MKAHGAPQDENMRLVRSNELTAKTGQTRTSNYRAIAAGLLPPPIKYGPANSVWPEHEIDAVIAARIAGKHDEEIRQLVVSIVKARGGALAAHLAQRAEHDPQSAA
jgi:prophage regulatory protein